MGVNTVIPLWVLKQVDDTVVTCSRSHTTTWSKTFLCSDYSSSLPFGPHLKRLLVRPRQKDYKIDMVEFLYCSLKSRQKKQSRYLILTGTIDTNPENLWFGVSFPDIKLYIVHCLRDQAEGKLSMFESHLCYSLPGNLNYTELLFASLSCL